MCPKGFERVSETKCQKINKVFVLGGRSINFENGKVLQPSVVLTVVGSSVKGEPKRVDCFQVEAAIEMERACSVMWKNKIHLFGGSDSTQIGRMDGHVLKRIGILPFVLFGGSCAAVQDQVIVLCFDIMDSSNDRCRQTKGTFDDFTDLPRTFFLHAAVPISASDSKYRGVEKIRLLCRSAIQDYSYVCRTFNPPVNDFSLSRKFSFR